jgi:hypothetical protein
MVAPGATISKLQHHFIIATIPNKVGVLLFFLAFSR